MTRSRPPLERWLRALRLTLLTVLGVQIATAAGLTLVDSYRRRGKKPQPLPDRSPGDGARSGTAW